MSWLCTETCSDPIQVEEERKERRVGKRQERKRESTGAEGGTGIWRERGAGKERGKEVSGMEGQDKEMEGK